MTHEYDPGTILAAVYADLRPRLGPCPQYIIDEVAQTLQKMWQSRIDEDKKDALNRAHRHLIAERRRNSDRMHLMRVPTGRERVK